MKKEVSVILKTRLQKFDRHGEKTGWTYIEIPADLTQQLLPGNKKMFRVKGRIDEHKIAGVFLLPMGDGSFILPVNAAMRKGIHKKEGAMVEVVLQPDAKKYELNRELMECLQEEEEALAYFRSLVPSHQNYFSKWVDAAKTDATKAQRIARTIYALQHKWDYGRMMWFYKKR
ncbi:hypothetical protein A8C56_17095 [Niabella ginsenosidivorans]|uniref:DUF1905 domain-containing protein n=1 Tax=Niabella ginsenosidivorans TaxID=1176587 RepID=A0A1A9I555_9BACT|nr:YdeI/OmpD-associated family protein [Niabella ginsenosidivorans]ANH82455.1 hypothetical protein A8C56_17095 [Niabella ginsenosidivorans]